MDALSPAEPGDARAAVAQLACRHSLGWLAAANLVGAWLAAVLVWPALGDTLAPLTFGRWAPVHFDWQLYGWCALPLVAALCHWVLDFRHPGVRRHAAVVLAAWSLALAAGGASWLAGQSSGKLFVEWHGWARGALPAAMGLLWTVLAAHLWWRRDTLARGAWLARCVVVGALAVVPPALYLAAGRDYFPAVNPDSGGATGAALLGSTLAIVTIYGALPRLLARPALRPSLWFWPALGASWLVFAAVKHTSSSHHEPAQILALAVLLAWALLLPLRWRAYQWTGGTRGWLAASLSWWVLLVVSGWLSFLPGISERLKFTNGLVAHAHLAMAGLVTSVNFVALQSLARGLDQTAPFRWWQGGCAAFVLLLLPLGWLENARAGEFLGGAAWTQWLYGGRLLAGGVMAVASLHWLRSSFRR